MGFAFLILRRSRARRSPRPDQDNLEKVRRDVHELGGVAQRAGTASPIGSQGAPPRGRDVHERRFFDVFGPRRAARGVPKLPRAFRSRPSQSEEQRAGGHEDVAAGFRVCGHELARELFQARPVVAVEPIADLGTHVQRREGVVHARCVFLCPAARAQVAAIVPAAAVVAQLRGVRAVHLVVLHETRLLARPDAGAALRGDALEHPARSTRPRVVRRDVPARTRSRSSKPAGQPARIAGCATDAAPPASKFFGVPGAAADSRAYAPTPPQRRPRRRPRGTGGAHRRRGRARRRHLPSRTPARETPMARTTRFQTLADPPGARWLHPRRRRARRRHPSASRRVAACPPRSPARAAGGARQSEDRRKGRTEARRAISSSGVPTFFAKGLR